MRIRVLLRIMSSEKTDVLRLRKKHLPKVKAEPTAEDPKRLLDAQSVGSSKSNRFPPGVPFKPLFQGQTYLATDTKTGLILLILGD
jgi:hypothetical protein